jgi:hypothetical protein
MNTNDQDNVVGSDIYASDNAYGVEDTYDGSILYGAFGSNVRWCSL